MLLKKRTALFLIIGFIIFLLVFAFKVKDEMVDFEVNYLAGKRIRTGETLYRIEDGHYQFKYSPFSAFLYIPLSMLPLAMAKLIWYFLIILSIFLIVYLSCWLLSMKKEKCFQLGILSSLILAKFFLRELQLGQINTLITFVLLLMTICIASEEIKPDSKKDKYVGLLWGFATALKPYALIFFPYFILTKKWKSLLSGTLFLASTLFFPSLFYGIKGNLRVLQEWKSSLSQSTPTLLDTQDNISIVAFFMKWTSQQKTSFFITISLVMFLAFLFLFVVLKGKQVTMASVLDSAILFIFIPLISPLGWDYTLLMSILGIMIILNHFYKYSKFWRVLLIVNLFVITFSLYDLLGRKLYATFMSWSVITVNFIIIIGYLGYLRFKKIC